MVAVQRTIVSPWRTTTAPEACLAILPVSNEISLAGDLDRDRRHGVSAHMYCLSWPAFGRRPQSCLSRNPNPVSLASGALRAPAASGLPRATRTASASSSRPPRSASRTSRRTRSATARSRRSASKRSRSRPSASQRVPQVRVVDAALVGVERVVERPRTRPGGAAASAACGQRRPRAGAWPQREVAEDDRAVRLLAQPPRLDRAARAARSRRRRRPAASPSRPSRTWSSARRGGDRCAAQVAHAVQRTIDDAHPHAATASRLLRRRARGGLRRSSPTPRNLEAITPPLLRFAVVTPGADRDGRRDAHPVPPAPARRADALATRSIQEWEPPRRFVDVQVRGPYALWHHTHEFAALTATRRTLMRDTVRYALGFGPLGALAQRAARAPRPRGDLRLPRAEADAPAGAARG